MSRAQMTSLHQSKFFRLSYNSGQIMIRGVVMSVNQRANDWRMPQKM